MSHSKTRAQSVHVSPSIWKRIRPQLEADVKERLGGTVKAGRYFAELIDRDRPFGKSTISRAYLDVEGEKVPEDLLRALCKEYGVPEPKIMAATEDEAKWFYAGRDLLQADSDYFWELLAKAQGRVRKITDIENSRKKLRAIDGGRGRKKGRNMPPDGGNGSN